MKKVVIFRVQGLLALCCLVGGCAALAPLDGSLGSMLGGGHLPADMHQQTSVSLSQPNFVLVRTNVVGTSKGFSLLGFITIVPATKSTALGRMYAGAQMQLGEPQTLADVIFERSSSYYILFGIPKVEVHADIVSFRPGAEASKRADSGPAPAKPPDQR